MSTIGSQALLVMYKESNLTVEALMTQTTFIERTMEYIFTQSNKYKYS